MFGVVRADQRCRRKSKENQPFYLQYLTLMVTLYSQPHKMVKHTQTIRRQFADDLFECV